MKFFNLLLIVFQFVYATYANAQIQAHYAKSHRATHTHQHDHHHSHEDGTEHAEHNDSDNATRLEPEDHHFHSFLELGQLACSPWQPRPNQTPVMHFLSWFLNDHQRSYSFQIKTDRHSRQPFYLAYLNPSIFRNLPLLN